MAIVLAIDATLVVVFLLLRRIVSMGRAGAHQIE
jgi:ABC-type Mn2+/Zn2+ transport system permease subunit